jgi:glycerate kinase
MRVVVAPDKFAGTMTAVEAAEAIANGWLRRAPDDQVVTVPMSDGGPGFCDVMHAALGGTRTSVTVAGPYGEPVTASVVRVGGTAYVESAQACGADLVPPHRRDPERATTLGVGQLVAIALDAGARRVVVGLGGSATNDAGAGLLAGLGATCSPAGALTSGPAGLAHIEGVDLDAARERVGDAELVAASDVDNPLLGLRGATNVYGGQKGIADERKATVDAALARFADLTDPLTARVAGAGAAGGLGFALLLLGADRRPGVGVVADAVDLPRHAAEADVVLTGEGAFDITSGSGKVVAGVASVAGHALRPCIVLAGQVLVGAREMRALGIEAAYGMADLVGLEAAMAEPAASLAQLSERVARTWSF